MNDTEILEHLNLQLAFHINQAQRYRLAIDALEGGTPPVEVLEQTPPAPDPAVKARKPTTKRSPKPTGYDHAELATVANSTRAGQTRRDAVAEHFGIAPAYAGQLIKQARDAGHDIPYDRQPKTIPDRRPPAPARPWTPERATAAIEANGTGDE